MEPDEMSVPAGYVATVIQDRWIVAALPEEHPLFAQYSVTVSRRGRRDTGGDPRFVVTRWPDAGRGEYFGADGLIVPQPRPPAGAEYPTSEQNDAYMALVRLDYDTAMTVAQQVVWRICHLGYFAAERIRCEAITGNVGCDWETASDPHDYQRRPDEDLAGREFGWAVTGLLECRVCARLQPVLAPEVVRSP
jgi:hypothetical protein